MRGRPGRPPAVEHQQSEEAGENGQHPHRDRDADAGVLRDGQATFEVSWAGRLGGRARAHDRQPQWDGQHGKDSVNDREAGDEVQERRERAALVIHERIHSEGDRGDGERDGDPADTAAPAGANEQW